MPAAIHSSQEACKKEIEGTASIRLITVDPSQLARHTPVLIFFLYEYWSCEISKHYFYYTIRVLDTVLWRAFVNWV